MSQPQDTVAYKILTSEQYTQLLRDEIFKGAPIDLADGYIHLSTAEQTQGTLDKHFAGQGDLYIAAVDLNAVQSDLQWEVSRGGALFPHIYADLPLSAVTAHGPILRSEDGKVIFPH